MSAARQLVDKLLEAGPRFYIGTVEQDGVVRIKAYTPGEYCGMKTHDRLGMRDHNFRVNGNTCFWWDPRPTAGERASVEAKVNRSLRHVVVTDRMSNLIPVARPGTTDNERAWTAAHWNESTSSAKQ